MNLKPQTKLGRWSVWLNGIFLAVISLSVLLASGLGWLSYDDKWWDATVPLAFFTSVAGFILGIVAIKRRGEKSVLVYASVAVGWLAILFVFLHSLFIND